MIKFDWRIFHSFLSVFKGKVVDHSELSALSSTWSRFCDLLNDISERGKMMRIKLREREDSAQFLLLTPPKTRTEHLIGRFQCNFKI